MQWVAALIISLILASNGLAQAREITSEQYYDAYAAALSTVSKLPRRRVQKIEEFKNGRLSKTYEEIEEVRDADNTRRVYIETIGKRQTRDEVVEVDRVYYCRSGSGQWRKSATDCAGRGVRLVTGDAGGTDHYSTEQVTVNSIPATVLRNHFSFNAPDNQVVWENLVWIDRDFRIIQRKYRAGTPNRDYISLVETYDYTFKADIRPPVK